MPEKVNGSQAFDLEAEFAGEGLVDEGASFAANELWPDAASRSGELEFAGRENDLGADSVRTGRSRSEGALEERPEEEGEE